MLIQAAVVPEFHNKYPLDPCQTKHRKSERTHDLPQRASVKVVKVTGYCQSQFGLPGVDGEVRVAALFI